MENLIQQQVVKAADVANRKVVTESASAHEVTLKEKLKSIEHPYVCSNRSMVVPDPKKTYGYFKTEFTVQSKWRFLGIRRNLETSISYVTFEK